MSGWDYGKTPNVWRPAEVQVPHTGADVGLGMQPVFGDVVTSTVTDFGYPPLGGGDVLKTVFDNQGVLGTVTGTTALTTIFTPTSVPISIYPTIVVIMLYSWQSTVAIAHGAPLFQFQVADGGGVFRNVVQWNSAGTTAIAETLSCGGVGYVISAPRLFMIAQTAPSFIEGRNGIAGGTLGSVNIWGAAAVLNTSDDFFNDPRVDAMRLQVQLTRTDDIIILQRLSLYGLLKGT